ncbi:HTH domain-containing protein [Companilactobacillus bobalius]|uniref:Putative frv operon regulatory protein n=1 Tax=Companilactobacillus bobalius TaxID=2801451 RepID=A0A202FAW4_9LACO|nr:HTH domain-containing protein [Companilactobacillus bobalius]KAE9562539.1 hypothetical protein ATN92_04425 [Companilactobacillus bobalius]OVE97606.1 putative frv operon regulatory protein [Companilactobacillus bobalius]GEO57783.1 transcriptional regulator [Companilactobacillus paralimentarius]
MLNARQVQILLLLWNQDHSGEYLSKEVNSSRRTIIRDISALNQELSVKNTAVINSEGKYSLEIHNYSQFQELITQFENQERNILYYLLTNDFLSIDELMDKSFLSKTDITNSIDRINQRNKDILEIKSKVGLGYSVDLYFATKVDLLAYLISVIPKDTDSNILKNTFPKDLREYLTDNQSAAQLQAISLISSANFDDFYNHKRDLLRNIKESTIENQIELVSKNFSIKLSKKRLAQNIATHLKRYNLFPTFISNLLLKQMSDLKQKEPFAFEMAQNLQAEIKKDDPSILINSDFLALYIINCMEIRTSIKPVRILMYTAQRSIAYINENLITDSVGNISMTSVFNIDEFNKQVTSESYDILVTNGFNDGLKHTPDVVINGLIDEATIFRLKKLVSDNYFHNNLTQMLPKENYLFYENRSDNYFKVLKNVLKYFIDEGQLDQKMSVKLLNREEEGNQLMINHVALPHAVNETDFSRMFAVDLKTPLKLNKTDIYLILIVIVNDKNDDYKQLFNYLYKILNKKQVYQADIEKNYTNILKYFRTE